MRRRGFTLGNLVIVIAVIAVLATMMMMSSTEAVTTTKATVIITNLLHIRKAVIEWYLDNRDRITYASSSTKQTDDTDIKFFSTK